MADLPAIHDLTPVTHEEYAKLLQRLERTEFLLNKLLEDGLGKRGYGSLAEYRRKYFGEA